MPAMRQAVATLLGGVMAVALAAPAMAGGDVATYHGVFSGAVDFKECTTPPPESAVASGIWNVIVRGDQATVSFNIFVDGAHHVSFGGPVSTIAASPGEAFAILIPTGAGPLRVSLTGTAFTYDIQPYDLSPWGGLTCADVTYHGVVRGN
jgi:hypothetical protein